MRRHCHSATCPPTFDPGPVTTMSKKILLVLYLLAMIALIVGLDLLFLRHHTAARLVVNVAIIAGFGVLDYKLLKDR